MEMIVSMRNNALKRIGGITYFIANNSCYTIRFIFDDIWSAYAVKTAYFIYEDGSAFPVTFEGDVCSVPSLLPGVCYIGVSAGEKLSSEPMRVRVCESVHDRIEDEVDEIPASAYDRIMEILNQILHDGTVNETDPTVPMWAKSPEKPKYTADEVGAVSKEQFERISEQIAIAGSEVYILGEGETLEDVPEGAKIVYDAPRDSGTSGSGSESESDGNGGDETVDPLVTTLMVTISTVEDGVYISDHYFADIYEHESNKGNVAALFEGIIYPLFSINANTAVFHMCAADPEETGLYFDNYIFIRRNTVFIESRHFGIMSGASADEDGTFGFIPAPAAGDENKYFRGDGTWTEIDMHTPTADDALELVAELGLAEPMTDDEGNVLTDENGILFIL